jgi:hypothetical protein
VTHISALHLTDWSLTASYFVLFNLRAVPTGNDSLVVWQSLTLTKLSNLRAEQISLALCHVQPNMPNSLALCVARLAL